MTSPNATAVAFSVQAISKKSTATLGSTLKQPSLKDGADNLSANSSVGSPPGATSAIDLLEKRRKRNAETGNLDSSAVNTPQSGAALLHFENQLPDLLRETIGEFLEKLEAKLDLLIRLNSSRSKERFEKRTTTETLRTVSASGLTTSAIGLEDAEDLQREITVCISPEVSLKDEVEVTPAVHAIPKEGLEAIIPTSCRPESLFNGHADVSPTLLTRSPKWSPSLEPVKLSDAFDSEANPPMLPPTTPPAPLARAGSIQVNGSGASSAASLRRFFMRSKSGTTGTGVGSTSWFLSHDFGVSRKRGKSKSSGGGLSGTSAYSGIAALADLPQFEYLKARTRRRNWFEKLLWSFLEDPDLVPGGRFFVKIFSVLIFISAFVSLLQTMAETSWLEHQAIEATQTIIDGIFVVEVIARLYSSPSRLLFFARIYNWIDLTSGIIPLVMRAAASSLTLSQAHFLEAENRAYVLLVVLLPVLRLLKVLRRFESFHLLVEACKIAVEALPVLLYVYMIVVLMFSAVVYVAESREHLPLMSDAIWFTIVTVSTVGYGDITPQSVLAHIIVSVLILLSALYMAIPIGIVGSAFVSVWEQRRNLLLLHRLRVRFITAGYKAEDIPALFYTFDADADGELSVSEFSEMMRKMEIEATKLGSAKLFSCFDADGSGAVDDEEFVRLLFPDAHARIYNGKEGECSKHLSDVPEDVEEDD